MRVLGLDPGLRATGWGIVDAGSGRLTHVANGTVRSRGESTAERLRSLYDAIALVIVDHHPETAAVEETFLNKNPGSTLKLGLARGVVLLAPARAGLPVAEYSANHVKKSVVGAGHAAKEQVAMMVGTLLPGCSIDGADAADALAVAICHAHHLETARSWLANDVLTASS
ncbi:MAG: crossover junction endodeoxyribonuclease RuvC [Alphaproteobacteria bacterium]|nr:crossover junction endodeoxyribonuclease RuvC [Alphaproteobacteria bacterium]